MKTCKSVLGIALVCFLMCSCDTSLQRKHLVGKWKQVNIESRIADGEPEEIGETAIWTFMNDSTYTIEDEEQTETVAELKISAGIGDDYDSAVIDAAKNAGKRRDHFIGIAQLSFSILKLLQCHFKTASFLVNLPGTMFFTTTLHSVSTA